MAKKKAKETCVGCGGEPHDVGLPKRHAECKTCGGRIRLYPLSTPGDGLNAGLWAHLDRADWIDSPHPAEPKDAAA